MINHSSKLFDGRIATCNDAKENNCIVVCKNPGAMYFKALNYGLTGIDFIYYNELKNEDKDKNYVIDDLDEFINENLKNVKGFSLTID